MNTTTCFICHNDFRDEEMLPLLIEGEACPKCAAQYPSWVEAQPDNTERKDGVA